MRRPETFETRPVPDDTALKPARPRLSGHAGPAAAVARPAPGRSRRARNASPPITSFDRTMNQDDNLPYSRYEVPSRIADLGFAVDLPSGWVPHPLPDAELNFEDPLFMVGLSVITAPHSALVFAVAARPAYDNGAVSDWAHYLVAQAGLSLRAQGEGRLGSLPALLGEAVLQSEAGPMLVRYAFAEDGGRLLNVTLTAPLMLAGAVRDVWTRAHETFRLDDARGATVPVRPPVRDAAPAPAVSAAPRDEAMPSPADEAATSRVTSSDWWHAALALEQAGQLHEAEQTILRAVNQQGACLCVAQLYIERHHRLSALGDTDGAALAGTAASRWAHAHAASATSGGEGLALSRERDALLARIGSAP